MVTRWLSLRSVTVVFAGAFISVAMLAIGVATLAPPPSPALPQAGFVGDTLGTPDGVAITLRSVEREPTRWLVHIHVHNSGSQAAVVLGTAPDHQFVLVGNVRKGTSQNQAFLQLTPPSTQELPAHSALPASANASGDSDGWLAANLSAYPFPVEPELEYRYDTLHTVACTNLTDQSTCHPANLYRVIIWRLS